MKQITCMVFFLLLLGQLNCAYGQAKWTTHFENEKVKISYRLADCNDRANDVNFSYYVLLFENKTKKQLNIQFETKDPKNLLDQNVKSEDYNSFILKPSETREGDCNSSAKELRQFYRNNKDLSETAKDKSLLILNVKTYEL
jgi:hypothetical protein